MNDNDAIRLFKCLADGSRLRILKCLMQEDMYVERLAERLDLSPSTVSFHLKKLEEAGAVRSQREQYYTVYSLNREVFRTSILDIISEKAADETEQQRRDAEYRQRIIDSFFEYGRLKSIPAQRKKKRVCLELIAEVFEPGVLYDERQLNELILQFHEDYCTIRRDMISEGILRREGGVYTRVK